MNTNEKSDKSRRNPILWIGLAAATVMGLTLLSQALADSPQLEATEEVESPAAAVRIISLPYVDTIALQHINLLGATEPTSITVQFVSEGGTELERITDPAFPAESIRLVTGPDVPTDTGRIMYEVPAGGGNLMLAVNLAFISSGNDAYLGLKLGDASPIFRMNIPWLMKNAEGRDSAFVLQNRGTSPATVSIEFYDNLGNNVCGLIETIPPDGSVTFYLPSILCQYGELEDGFTGSAYIEATEPAVSAVYALDRQHPIRSSYQGVDRDGTSTVLTVPALFKAHDLQTSALCIHNINSPSANVLVEYSDGLTATATIPPNSTSCLDQGAEGHAAGWAGGATISGGRLAAVVDVTAYDGTTPVGRWAYNATPSTSFRQNMKSGASQSLAFPFLVNNDYGWTSTIYLYNPAELPVVITPRYVLANTGGFVYCAEPFTIPPRSLVSISQAQLPQFSSRSMAYFNTTGPVAAAVSATSSSALGTTDRHFGYEAAYPGVPIQFPDNCDTMQAVFLPLVAKQTN